MQNLISFIIPVYNKEKYVHACIASIQSQTYQNFEIVMVDDGSTDASGQICDEEAAKDARIRVFHQKNAGPSAARNRALDEAVGQYIMFTDSDDAIHPQMAEILLSGLQKYDAQIAYCKTSWLPEEQRASVGKERYQLDEIAWQVFEGDAVMQRLWDDMDDATIQCDKLFRREIFDTIRFEVGRYHEDEFLVHQELYIAEKVVYTPIEMYFYFQHRDGIMGTITRGKKQDAIAAFEHRCNFFKEKGLQQDYEKSVCELLNFMMTACMWLYEHGGKPEEIKEYKQQLRDLHKTYAEGIVNLPDVLKIRMKTVLHADKLYAAYLAGKHKKNDKS